MQSRFCIRNPRLSTYAEGLQFGLSVPRDALTPRVTNVDSLTMRPISRRTEALRLLMTYLKSALKEGALAAPKLRDAVVTLHPRSRGARNQRVRSFGREQRECCCGCAPQRRPRPHRDAFSGPGAKPRGRRHQALQVTRRNALTTGDVRPLNELRKEVTNTERSGSPPFRRSARHAAKCRSGPGIAG